MVRKIGGFGINNQWAVGNLYKVRQSVPTLIFTVDEINSYSPIGDPLDLVPRNDITVNIYEDPCNLLIDTVVNLDVGTNKFTYTHNRIIRKPFCTFPPKIQNRYNKNAGLSPIIVPTVDDQACWINLLWNKEYYYDGERAADVDNTGEGWKHDSIDVELLEVKYPVYFEFGFTGAEITLKVKYQSTKSDYWLNQGSYTSAAPYEELHSLNYEWVHTYRIWDRFEQNNPGVSYYIVRESFGQYKLYAPHSADHAIALVYPQAQQWLIESRWGENATSPYRIQPRSYFQSSLTDYEFNGSRDNRRIVNVSSPQRSYTITRDIDNPMVDFYGVNYRVSWSQYIFKTESWEILSFTEDYQPPPDPPPPPPDKKPPEDMCCEELKRLLLLVLQRIGPLPANVPNSLVRANSGTKSIGSLAEFIAYSIIQTNAQFGHFPQEINIQDADLTQEGDQSKKVKLPNLAESISEIVGMLLVLQSESNANLIATVNAMVEAGNAKQLALLASDYAAANAEFLGYKGKQIEHKVPFTFKPGEQQLDKMLKSGEIKVKGWENDDKNDLNDVLIPLLEMAAMYRAQNFRNIGTGDTLNKLTAILKGGAVLGDALDFLSKRVAPPDPENPDAPRSQPKVDEWDAFIESVEQGFISQPGITDSLNPYGRPLEQRPKIRDIGQDTSEDT